MTTTPLAISYPPDLPVSQMRDEIRDAIAANQVVIVAGETGSGKTTQLPKICLELGRTMIGHTQPRRIAARTIAERIADELGGDIGGLVGYQVRFTDEVSAETRVKLMTDGILLNEIHRDRLLRKYDTIIIDEAHERSLNIDFLLGYLKTLLPKRPDLKVIITSATIDPESFSKHFNDAPMIEVSGRTFPVDVRYRPLVADAALPGDPASSEEDGEDAAPQTPERDMFEGIVDALDELDRDLPGDVLVFLSGEQEIRDAQDAIRAHLARGRRPESTEVLPLFGRLSSAEQHRVFESKRPPGVRRRIVLATNVAETSLTVPGIVAVIDTGTARISRYSTRAKVQRLPIEAISQASAKQRSGRAGRTSAGVAIRLYSEADFDRRPEFTEPEILRTNLASVLLQMLELGLGALSEFPFLQPPDARGIKDGTDLLSELGAVEPGKASQLRLTKTGRSLARLPIDPRFGRMVIESKQHDVSREVLIIVAGMTVQDIRERPLDHRQKADELHARFRDPSSDFLTLVNLWNYLEEQSHELGSSAFRRKCRDEFINFVRFREWQDVFRQLRQLAGPIGLKVQRPAAGQVQEPGALADAIHRSMLAGLLSHIGIRDELKRDYAGARGTRFQIFPGSGLAKAKKQPDVVMAAELVETSRLFARTVAKIDPAWAEALAGDLAKRNHSDPHWEKKQGSAVAIERVTLYGVPIVRGRTVQFSKIDPAWSRDLFIRHALVEGDWNGRHSFDSKNRALRKSLADLEERTRSRGAYSDDEDAVFEFYDERLPRDVVSQSTFEKWWQGAQKQTPQLLTMTRADVLGEEHADPDEQGAGFPTEWNQGDQRLRLRYRFDPGAPDDGVTVNIPLPLLSRLDDRGFDWQVPGMRRELVIALLKSLPKATRRNFVPSADWADKLLGELGEVRPDLGQEVPGDFDDALRQIMQRQAGIRFDVSEFDWSRVPSHLRARFRVLDDRGRELGTGEDLKLLQEKLKKASEASVLRATQQVAAPARPGSGVREAGSVPAQSASTAELRYDQHGLTEWPLDEIPELIDIKRKHGVIRAYPSLAVVKGSIDLRLVTTPQDQAREHPIGVAALLAASVPSPASYVQEHLTAKEKLALATSPYHSTPALFSDIVAALAQDAVAAYGVEHGGPVRTRAAFEELREEFNASLLDRMFAQTKLVSEVLDRFREANKALKSANHISVLPSLADARSQLQALVYPGFVSKTGVARLGHLPRYLRALTYRLERVLSHSSIERAGLMQVEQATALYTEAGGTFPVSRTAPASIVQVRWMLEEFRVSLFAQQLGTAETVSLKRIRQALSDK